MVAPTVFISYSHDSKAHAACVLAFADSLKKLGITVLLDQFNPDPELGWTRWMEDGIEGADRVLLVCTETYLRRGQICGFSEEGSRKARHVDRPIMENPLGVTE